MKTIIDDIESELLNGYGEVSDARVGALVKHARGLQSTLRDQFAMAALTGELARPTFTPVGQKDPKELLASAFARAAYKFADAMLQARQENPDE